MAPGVVTFDRSAFSTEGLMAVKGTRTVSVCVPARNEAATVGSVVAAVARPHLAAAGGSGLVDEVLVVDDGSVDETGARARAAGARVLRRSEDPGKGQAMRAALEAAVGDLVVFLDADVVDTTESFVTGLVGPLLVRDDLALVKGCYERPFGDSPTGGGRVTELVARPLLELCFAELAEVRQPLAGETAAPRWVLDKVGLSDGYGVEFGLLVDVAARFGTSAIAQVDLGTRTHRNRPLDELRPQAVEVLRAGLTRAGVPFGPPTGAPGPPGEGSGGP
ncbi:MAG: glucosyl-3-phosphoglycerate synthase [Acidimicrobiales bacterium]